MCVHENAFVKESSCIIHVPEGTLTVASIRTYVTCSMDRQTAPSFPSLIFIDQPHLPSPSHLIASRKVAALVSRLEKSVPKAAAKAEANPPADIKDVKIDKAPEPLREVLAAKTAEKGTITGGKPLNRNPSMHMGGYAKGDQKGTLNGSARAGSPPPAPPTIGTLPSFSLGSPVRSGAEEDALDTSAASTVGGDEGKCAEDVLADVQASEEIFGKAFRGGPKAAAGLAARLQREVRVSFGVCVCVLLW